MIKKVEIITNTQPQTELEKAILRVFNGVATKLNEIVDTVNDIQKEREAERFEIQEWIGILEAVRESVNIQEKQIDELQMKLEPHKCEPAENTTDSKMENVVEQRKWIGKICKFWNWSGPCLVHYSKLITIKDTNDGEMTNCPFRADDGNWYMCCEPVKPDSELIYHGE